MLLNGLDSVDTSGAAVIAELLAQLTTSGRLASVVGLDQQVDRECRRWPTCGCEVVGQVVEAAGAACAPDDDV